MKQYRDEENQIIFRLKVGLRHVTRVCATKKCVSNPVCAGRSIPVPTHVMRYKLQECRWLRKKVFWLRNEYALRAIKKNNSVDFSAVTAAHEPNQLTRKTFLVLFGEVAGKRLRVSDVF